MVDRWTSLRETQAKASQAPATPTATPAAPALSLVPAAAKAAENTAAPVERKPQFAIGTQFRTRDRFPKLCTVTDILTTRNSRGEVVGIAYEATHQFCGQTVTDHNVCQVTIARGLVAQPAVAL